MASIKPRAEFMLLVSILMAACDEVPTEAIQQLPVQSSEYEVENVIAELKKELIWVEGGVFMMGDYGAQYGDKQGFIDMQETSKPVHEVELSSYSMSKYKITNRAYQVYLRSNGLVLRPNFDKHDARAATVPNLPAAIDWNEASAFCNWLSLQTGLPFALPTEAQWEFAARSRGQFVPVATNNGTWKDYWVEPETHQDDGSRGINISTFWDRTEFARSMGWSSGILTLIPVGRYPPNPLGMDSMTDNGLEWVNDWYDPDYYDYSPRLDPVGPTNPVVPYGLGTDWYLKVLRGEDYSPSVWRSAATVRRSYDNAHSISKISEQDSGVVTVGNKTARCVVNASDPISGESSPTTGAH